MKDQQAIESEIMEWLEEIKPVQPRNVQAAQRNRAKFLSQAVSANELPRHKGWKFLLRKEQFAMKALITFLVLVGLWFGGGATVSAAQNDLPDEPLYGLKIWSEDLSLLFQNPSEEKVDRLMDLAQVRVQEMAQIDELGKAVPDQVRLRLERQIQQALQICSTLDDQTMNRALLQVRDRLQEQDREVEQLQLRSHQDSQPVLEQTRQMLQLRLQLVNDGLLDHQMFRNAARNGFRHGQDEQCPPGQCTSPMPTGTGLAHGQPTSVPGGQNANTGSPTPNPGGPNTEPGSPNTTPGGPNLESGGSMDGSGPGSGGNMNDSGGSGYGGDESGCVSDGNGHGGSGSGDGMGGNGSGGDGSGSGLGGGGGSGGNRP